MRPRRKRWYGKKFREKPLKSKQSIEIIQISKTARERFKFRKGMRKKASWNEILISVKILELSANKKNPSKSNKFRSKPLH